MGTGREFAGAAARQHRPHWAQLFLDFADDITDARLWAAAQLAFAYSTLRFIEAYGLWKQRTWAEWVAFGSGALLIPLEIRELTRGLHCCALGF